MMSRIRRANDPSEAAAIAGRALPNGGLARWRWLRPGGWRASYGMTLAVVIAMVAACGRADAEQTVHVDLNQRYQTIDGFGTCLIGWDRDYDRLYATEAFQRVYAEEVGCSMLRINMWGPVMQVPEEDWRDITYKKFYLRSRGHRARTFLEFARAVKKLNPQIKLVGSVWTPPPWMKINQAITDDHSGAISGDSYAYKGGTITNRVKPELFRHFAKWMVEMVKMHEAEGVPFYAVSIGNEVMFTQSFDSCVWTAEDYATVVRYLGEMLESEGLGHVKIFGPETMTGHNWETANPLYIRELMKDPETAKHFDIFATHGYTDGFQTDTSSETAIEFRKLIEPYGRRFWITEGGTGLHNWPLPLTQIGSRLHNALVHGNASAVMPWQISEKTPEQQGMMVFDRQTHKTHVATHYFRFIRPGAVRVDASPSDGQVIASAYLHEADRMLTMVLTNPTLRDQTVTVRVSPLPDGLSQMQAYRTSESEEVKLVDPVTVEDGAMTITLAAESIVTLQGSFTK